MYFDANYWLPFLCPTYTSPRRITCLTNKRPSHQSRANGIDVAKVPGLGVTRTVLEGEETRPEEKGRRRGLPCGLGGGEAHDQSG